MTLRAFAPAKVNLFLHVGRPGGDGHHPIASLILFADVGDELRLEPADAFEVRVEGPFAAELAHEPDNLVARAARAVAARSGVPLPPSALVLDKHLPVASGLGGGTSDGAAALRLVNAAVGSPLDEAALAELAQGLGSDGPACLSARPVVAQGRGERLSPAPVMSPLHAVLVHPGTPSPTAAVYRSFDDAGAPGDAGLPSLPERFESADHVARWLHGTRNDLEGPAAGLEPAVAVALSVLETAPGVSLARMSGSGATCFALCADEHAAATLASELSAAYPFWWVRSCRLGGPWDRHAGNPSFVNA